jgi:8-oxo-dGTP pyrophosphatase MutT (NUDIX family)
MVGNFITVTSGTFVDPNGFTFERDLVRHPGAVCVVPLEDGGNSVLMVRQYRAPIDTLVLEFPAGKLDVPGEKVELCAERELAEEAGRAAGQLSLLGTFYNSPGFTDERTTCFLAESLTEVPQALQGIEEQHLSVESIPIARFWAMVDAGTMIDAKSMLAMFLTERHLATRA